MARHYHPIYLTQEQRRYLERHPMDTWKRMNATRREIRKAYYRCLTAEDADDMFREYGTLLCNRPDMSGVLTRL